ncbi:hypothetical protein LCGC14_2735260, partial [marine sediment metagenome]
MSKLKKAHIPDFSKVRKVLSAVAQEVTECHIEEFAEAERASFVREVERQNFDDFNAAPLKPSYRARKVRLGLDPRVMIRTRHYLDSIRVFRRKNSAQSVTFHVGFHARALARDDKGRRVPFLLRYLAAVHEEGSHKAHIPRRRHWRPHLARMHERAPRVRARIKAEIRERARKKLPAMLA